MRRSTSHDRLAGPRARAAGPNLVKSAYKTAARASALTRGPREGADALATIMDLTGARWNPSLPGASVIAMLASALGHFEGARDLALSVRRGRVSLVPVRIGLVGLCKLGYITHQELDAMMLALTALGQMQGILALM
jgi:hypothetical protein